MIGLITLDAKHAGERSAGNPPAPFDVAGAGNVTMAAGLRATAKALEPPPEPKVGAPVFDPTRRGACGIVVAMGAGLRPNGKPLDRPPDPAVMCAPHFYPDPPRPGEKSTEQGRPYNRYTGKAAEGERESDGSIVASKRGNARGAKGPCCL